MSQAVIECEGVSKSFDGAPVLTDITLTLHRGEVVGVIGPGGHGKSVLLKVLAGLVTPDKGRVLVEGEDLARMSADQLRRTRDAYGYLFQNYALFDFMTVADNVAFPLRQQEKLDEAAIAERVQALLSEVGMGHALQLFPNELSGGMKKRVSLARAVIAEPEILLYDDPSAGLDPVTSSKIFRLIQRAREQGGGRNTALVVSHDIDRMKAVCDRYVMVYEGRVLYAGPESGITAAPALVGEFFYGAVGASAAGTA